MKKERNSKEEHQEQFGANAWFVESLQEQYNQDPDSIPAQWKKYFEDGTITSEEPEKEKAPAKEKSSSVTKAKKPVISMPQPSDEDETRIIAGSAARILENMEASLTVPVATSQRSIPVKLLEENRLVLNNYLLKEGKQKVSFTHIIGYAIVRAMKEYPSLNNGYTELEGKPYLIERKHINLGIAIDVERRDGSRSLLVPNIKKCETMNFKEFVEAYNTLVDKSRSGQIDPAEFMGTTVSLTNPGMLGTVTSIPRLMVGQGTIVATGSIQYPAEYQAMAPEVISTLGVSKIITISNTYDHRIIQGAESGLFLKELHEILLGKENFFANIFNDMGVPFRALEWQTDLLPKGFGGDSNIDEIAKHGRVRQMINMYRVRGHLLANINPLGVEKMYHEELDPSFYKLTLWDLDREFVTHGFGGMKMAKLRKILDVLHRTYCDKIGVEYMHIQNPAEKAWLQDKMEPVENRPNYDETAKKQILKKLIEAEQFEHFIHTKFIGHKRFSLEGSETVIPYLDYLLTIAADNGVGEIVLGMAHRGRLNVLANIVGKDLDSMLSEFEDIVDPNSYAGSGDVKYHLGAYGRYKTRFRREIGVSIAPNPSHLEWVNPVVEGIVRAKQTRMQDTERRLVMPLLIHGDAAFAGQGVVAETLNLSQLVGYRTGGTVHLIINNQIGFTTNPKEARSSVYASDVAKMVQAPIFHVNGDDPEAALHVAKLAFEYRQKFKKDIVIDLLTYRRYGHNEGDEPGFTQPLMYRKIRNHPGVAAIYADKLAQDDVVSDEEFKQMKKDYYQRLDEAYQRVNKKAAEYEADMPLAVSSEKVFSHKGDPSTNIPAEMVDDIIVRSTTLPDGFNIHPKLKKFVDKRREAAEDDNAMLDWAFAETIAFGSLLKEHFPIRLSGQDSVRGTFSQRHLAFTDNESGKEYIALNHMYQDQSRIEALDSLLSEAAVMGFEYGYSSADPLSLVMWEAQFGDFANGAQVIIDNFIVVSQEKWRSPNNLVLLLPHGYEGQGPEHSSGRLERFLILCAEGNMEVCYPTTPSQYFHLLRRQMKKDIVRPLVVMTPKSLLRLPDARSPKHEFTEGAFAELIDDAAVKEKSKIDRVIITSGKVYYDLLKYREKHNQANAAIVRLEQFYPFRSDLMRKLLSSYKHVSNILWVQEEPENMGGWNFVSRRIERELLEGQKLQYIGRPESASPAVGSSRIAAKQQQTLVKDAFTA